MPTLGERLRAVREGRRMSLREFAAHLSAHGGPEVSHATVGKYEHGTRVPAEYAAAVAEAFDVAPRWLLLGEGSMTAVRDPVLNNALEQIAGAIEELRAIPRPVRSQIEDFFDRTPELFAILSPEGRILRVNPRWETLLGYSRQRLVGRPLSEIAEAGDRADVDEELGRAVGGGEAHSCLFRVRTPGGLVRWLSGVAGWTGRVIVSAFRDVTEEQEARSMERLLRVAVEHSDDCLLITDTEGVILYVNHAFERATGYSAAEAVGRPARILRSGEHEPSFYRRLWDTIRDGQVFRGVIVNRRKSGETYEDDRTIAPVRGLRGEITHFVSTGRDLTRRPGVSR